MRILTTLEGQAFDFDARMGDTGPRLSLGGRELEARCTLGGPGAEVVLRPDGPSHFVALPPGAADSLRRGEAVDLLVDGEPLRVRVERPSFGAPPAASRPAPEVPRHAAVRGGVYPPMPGVIVRLAVQEGERVAAGDLLLTLEAMKMQNELRAPRAGQVRGLAAKPGQKVDKSTLLLVLDEP